MFSCALSSFSLARPLGRTPGTGVSANQGNNAMGGAGLKGIHGASSLKPASTNASSYCVSRQVQVDKERKAASQARRPRRMGGKRPPLHATSHQDVCLCHVPEVGRKAEPTVATRTWPWSFRDRSKLWMPSRQCVSGTETAAIRSGRRGATLPCFPHCRR